MKILEKFSHNYKKRLNFTKLAGFLKITPSEGDILIGLLFNFQELFSTTFKDYVITKKIIDNQQFLLTEPKSQNQTIPIKIKLSLKECNRLSDIMYLFKFVKRGKGFDVKANGTELLGNIKELWEYHPYLFNYNENGLMYPSEFGLKLGEILLSYTKSGKKLESLSIDDHKIMVNNHKR
jgi:hypothetical protein